MESANQNKPLVSAFDLHHKVNIRYPALEILTPFEEFKMAFPKDVETRYEPSSLVKDPKVEEHTDRDTKETTRFVSYTKALPGHSEQYDEEEHDAHDIKAIVNDMGKLSSCAGTTELWASLCKVVIPGFEERQQFNGVSFRRVSKLRCADGSVKESKTFYAMSAKSFLALKLRRGLRDLYRAEEEPEVEAVNFLVGWKAARAPCLVPSVGHKVTAEELEQEVLKNEDNSECQICKFPYDHDGVVPVQISGCNHIYCHSCLNTWMAGKDATSTCPSCRTFLTTPEQYLQLTHGTDAVGHYIHDARYNEWENFERSCADLDRTRAKVLLPTADNTIRVNAKRLVRLWEHFVESARTEPESSTPFHHNPANFPELEIITTTLSKSLNQIDTATVSASTLYRMLVKDVENAFFKTFICSDAATLVDSGSIALAHHDPERAGAIMGLRPNLWPFFELTLNRMINFVRLRRCESAGGMDLHVHGACRMYYSD